MKTPNITTIPEGASELLTQRPKSAAMLKSVAVQDLRQPVPKVTGGRPASIREDSSVEGECRRDVCDSGRASCHTLSVLVRNPQVIFQMVERK